MSRAAIVSMALLTAWPSAAQDSVGYPQRSRLAEQRGASLALAEACEVELRAQPPPSGLVICNQFRVSVRAYLLSMADRFSWCANQLERGWKVSPDDCVEDVKAIDTDPVHVRINAVASKLGLPPIAAAP